MARKFWERVSGQKLRFYTDPEEFTKDDVVAEIARLQAILLLPDETKALIAAGQVGSIQTEAEFAQLFQRQIDELADILDYWTYDQQTEDVVTVLQGWMSPADMALGPATIVAVCGEEVGNESAGAIDGTGTTNWQHDEDHAHEIIFDLGYSKRIDGICVKNTASPGNPLLLRGCDVYVNNTLNGLATNANAHVGVGLDFADPDRNERDLATRNGRYVRMTIAGSDHNSNHVTVRDIELRVRARTFNT